MITRAKGKGIAATAHTTPEVNPSQCSFGFQPKGHFERATAFLLDTPLSSLCQVNVESFNNSN